MKRSEFQKKYSVIKQPGVYTIAVAQSSKPFPLLYADGEEVISTREGTEGLPLHKRIVNTFIVRPDAVDKVVDFWKGREEASDAEVYEMLRDDEGSLLMTGNIIFTEGNDPGPPMRGQKIKVSIDWVPNRLGEEILNIVETQIIEAGGQIESFSFDDFFENEAKTKKSA